MELLREAREGSRIEERVGEASVSWSGDAHFEERRFEPLPVQPVEPSGERDATASKDTWGIEPIAADVVLQDIWPDDVL